MADGVTLDTLEIQIEAKSQSAASKIDELCKKIDILSDGFKKLDIGNMNKVAGAIGNVSGSLKNVSNIKGDGIRDVANALNTLSKVNVENLNSLAGSIPALQKSLDGIGAVTFNSDGLNAVGEALRQFGYKTSTLGTQNLEKLKTDLVEFINGINSAGAVNFDFSGLENLVQNLSRLGSKNVTQAAANLQPLKEQLLDFINGLNSTGGFDTSGLNALVSDISKLGGKSVTNAIVNLPQLESTLTQVLQTLSTAPKVSQNVIDLTNALANLAAQGSKVGNASNSIVKGLNRTNTAAKSANKSMTSLAAVFGKFYASCFLVIRGVKKLWENIESSMDYIETSNYFEVSLSQISKQFERYGYESAEAYGEALEAGLSNLNSKLTGYTLGTSGEALFSGDVGLGMDIESMMNFQAKTLAVTNSVGLLGNASVETTKALSMLAGDLSSLTNLDISSVMDSLSSGLIGQSRALYRFGIDITNNTLQQYTLAEGIDKAVSEMMQSEKMQLRLLAILDQSQVAWGDLGNTVNSVANQYRVFEQQIGNLGRTLGNLFLPIVKNVLPYVNGLIIALNNLFTTLGFDLWGDSWLEDLQDGISGSVTDDLEGIEDASDSALESMNELLKGVRGFDVLNVISTGSSSTSNSGITNELQGTIDLTDSIKKAVANYESAWNKAFETAENKASEFAKTLTEMIEQNNFVNGIRELISNVEDFSDALQPFNNGFANGFLKTLNDLSGIAFSGINNGIKIFSEVVSLIPSGVLEDLSEVLGGFAAGIVAVNSAMLLINGIKNGISILMGALTASPVTIAIGTLTALAAAIKVYYDNMQGLENGKFNEINKSLSESIATLSTKLSSWKNTVSELENNKASVLGAIQDYYDLLNNDELDWDDKQQKLKLYVEYIVGEFPSLAEYVDNHTGLFTANKEEILQNVDAAVQYAKTVATQDTLIDAYKDYYKALAEGKQLAAEYNALYDDIHSRYPSVTAKEKKELQEAYDAYKEASEKVGKLKEQLTLLEDVVSDAQNGNKKFSANMEETQLATQNTVKELMSLNASSNNLLEIQSALINKTQDVSRNIWDLSNAQKDTADSTSDLTQNSSQAAKSLENISTQTNVAINKVTDFGKAVDDFNKKKLTISIDDSALSKLNSLSRFQISTQLSYAKYSVGGFPEDGWFRASKGEYFGQFDDGTSYIANNNQITDGIASGVYQAVLSAMGNANSAGSTPEIRVYIGDREIEEIAIDGINRKYREGKRPLAML